MHHWHFVHVLFGCSDQNQTTVEIYWVTGSIHSNPPVEAIAHFHKHKFQQICTKLPWSAFSFVTVNIMSTYIIGFWKILSVNWENPNAVVQVTFVFIYKKYINKVYCTLSKYHQHPTPLCVTDLILSLNQDKKGRYNGFWYDGNTIDQLDEIQLQDG